MPINRDDHALPERDLDGSGKKRLLAHQYDVVGIAHGGEQYREGAQESRAAEVRMPLTPEDDQYAGKGDDGGQDGLRRDALIQQAR